MGTPVYVGVVTTILVVDGRVTVGTNVVTVRNSHDSAERDLLTWARSQNFNTAEVRIRITEHNSTFGSLERTWKYTLEPTITLSKRPDPEAVT